MAGIGALQLTARTPACTCQSRASRCRQPVRVRSRASSKGPETPRPRAPASNPLQQVKTGLSQLTERYDVLSTSAGALVCTSFFWSRGQDPFEALWITFCATIAGLVINEVFFDNES